MTKIGAEVSGMGTRRRVTELRGGAIVPRLGRVLVVEDEHDVAELIRYHLAKEGYDVRVSENGADALRQVREVSARAGPARHHGAAAQWLGGLPPPQAGSRDARHLRSSW